MAEQPEYVDATFYAVIEPHWSSYSRDAQGRPILDGARLVNTTAKAPKVVRNGAVVTRLTLRMDAGTLLPLQPQAVVHVHPGQAAVIEVHAEDPELGADQ